VDNRILSMGDKEFEQYISTKTLGWLKGLYSELKKMESANKRTGSKTPLEYVDLQTGQPFFYKLEKRKTQVMYAMQEFKRANLSDGEFTKWDRKFFKSKYTTVRRRKK